MRRGAVLGVVAVLAGLAGGVYWLGDSARKTDTPVAPAVPVRPPVVAAPVAPVAPITVPAPQIPAPPPPPLPSVAKVRVHDEQPLPEHGCSQRSCGPETPAAPSQFDARSPMWMERLHHWMEQRDALLKDASLAPEQRAAQIEQLRAQQFNAEEQAQVLAMEQAHDAAH